MKKIKKILVPTDFSELANNAFRNALWFADRYEANIELLHVIYPETEPLDFPVMVGQATMHKIEAAKEVMKMFVDNSMVQVQAAHQLEHVPVVTSSVVAGTPASLIREAVRNNKVDLVIMGTHGEQSAFEKFFGSVTTGTIEKVDCPVMVVPENATFDYISTIAFATDLSDADPFRIWETCKLLAPFSPIVHIVHIKQPTDEGRELDMADLKQFFENNAPGLQVNFHVFGSTNVAQELEEFAEAREVDLLILQKPQRSFFERLFHRSVSRELALISKVPLLILQ